MSSQAASRRTSAFTLIEMLVAVTVLAVMTLLLARIISQSNTVISDGSRQATQNANARMALDFLAREFAQAGGDGRLHFQRNESAMNPYGSTVASHDLRFATFRNLPDPEGFPSPRNTDREAVLVAYYLKDNYASLGYYSLMRAEQRVASSGPYTDLIYSSGGNEAELIRYVVEFRAVCHTTNSVTPMNSSEVSYLPTYMDVYLAVLSESDAKRAKTMSGSEQRSFIVRTAKRYHTRCWSLNRTSYIGGR